MGKQKKTREQKIIADLRKKLQTQNQKELTFEFKSSAPKTIALPTKNLSYPYLKHDILKTMTLTGSLVALELILSLLLKNRLITLPSLSF